jgi:hypothetical protein
MQENEFEKQVRDMMKEFKISPSDAVWKKVEQEIPKQKRGSRWMIFVFLLMALMVSGYFLYNYYNRSIVMENVAAKNQNEKTKNNLNNNKKNEKRNASVTNQQNESSQKSEEEKNTTTITKKVNNDISLSITKGEQHLNKQSEKKETQTQLQSKVELEKNETINSIEVQKNIIEDTLNKNSVAVNASEQKPDSTKNLLKDSTQPKATVSADKKRKLKNDANKKWQFGITAFYGRSDVFEKLNSSSVSFFANPGTGNGFPSNPVNSSNIKAKDAFSLGVSIKKNISSKSSLRTGLQYSKFQTQIETGEMLNSTAVFRYNNLIAAPTASLNSFYKPGTGYPHKNSYSFIQIPVVYDRSITKNKLVNVDAGASLSRLIASNALIYDSYNRAYYNNNDLFEKTQLTFLAGINTQFKLGATSIDIGPQFQYGLTNLFKHNDYGNQHLFTLGLQANIFLKK